MLSLVLREKHVKLNILISKLPSSQSSSLEAVFSPVGLTYDGSEQSPEDLFSGSKILNNAKT